MDKLQKNIKYIVGVAIIVIVAVVALLISSYVKSGNQLDTADTTDAAETAKVVQSEDVITYTAKSGTSALSQLQEINDTVVVQESDLGSYVESINGLVGGTDGKYWSFYVNDELASVGAGEFMPEGGEEIKWHFVKL